MKVLKFGGTSLATTDAIRAAAGVIGEAWEEGPVVVVVSAFGGVTDTLVAAGEAAAGGEGIYGEMVQGIEQRYLAAAQLASATERESVRNAVHGLGEVLHDLLRGIELLRQLSSRSRDSILAFGEDFATTVVAAALRTKGLPAVAWDARQLIITDATFGRARVEVEATYGRIRERLSRRDVVPVVTGFIAAAPSGQTTTLGRGGSDYTAALLGAALGAASIELWTDVDGVMSADPRRVPAAFVLPSLSYVELMELSHFGAKVVYPPSVHPARAAGIPLVIKNTFATRAAGTRIAAQAPPGRHAIRGLTSISQVALMGLEGEGMIGVPGVAERLFGALARVDVSVILISQGSSEQSICFAVAPQDVARAQIAVDEAFAGERRQGLIYPLQVEDDQAVITAVGEGMRERPGIAGRLFGVLGDHGINVRTIALGSSRRSISLVVDREAEARALNALHEAFFAPLRRVAVAVAADGPIGEAFLARLAAAAPRLEEEEGLALQLVAVTAGGRLAMVPAGLAPLAWRAAAEGGEPLTGERLVQVLAPPCGAARLFVDCTMDGEAVGWYPALLAAGVGVVTANPRPFAAPAEAYGALRAAARRAPLCHGAAIGAAMPLLATVAALRRSGDRVLAVEGVLSAFVNAVLDGVAAGTTLSAALRRADEAGLCTAHPYDELSGVETARRLCALARAAGLALEMEAITVESLLPEGTWPTHDRVGFRQALPAADAPFAARWRALVGAGGRVRYLARLDEAGARVGLEVVPGDHFAHHLDGAACAVAVFTERHGATPLLVRGPGGGPEPIAAGLFADLLGAAETLTPPRF